MNNSPILVGITIRADGSAQVTGELNRVRESFTGAGSAAQNTNRQFADMASTMSRFGAILGGITFAALARDILSVNREMETLRATLKSVTGSAANGMAAFNFIQDFAKNTPYEIEGLTRTFIKLKGMGLEPTRQVMEALTNQASLLGGSQETLSAIALQLGQAYSKQKLQQEDLVVLAERGVPIYKLLAQVTGENGEALSELISKGQITTDVIDKLIVKMGELASGANADAMNTLNGAISSLSDAWHTFEDTLLNDRSEGLIRSIVQGITESISTLTNAFGSSLDNQIETLKNMAITKQAFLGQFGIEADTSSTDKLVQSLEAQKNAAAQEEQIRTASARAIAETENWLADTTDRSTKKQIASHSARAVSVSAAQKAANAAAAEAKRNYDQAIKSSDDYIKRLKNETAQIGMNATQRADFAAEQIAATMAESKVTSAAIVKFLNEAHELTVALEAVKEAEKMDEAVKTEMDALIDRYQQLTLSAEEYFAAKLKAQGLSAEQAEPLIKQNTINNDLEKQKEAADAARQALESYTSSIDSASSSMQNLGDVTGAIFDSSLGGVNQLVGAFENMLKGINQSKQAYADLAEKKKLIDNFDPSLYADQTAAIKLKAEKQTQYEKDYQNLQTQTFDQYMNGTRQMAGALTSMFEDNKQAQIANQAVALVTLGIQAVQAIVTQGQGDPYTAFARIAAMAAIVGSMVASVGGKSPKAGSAGVMAQSKTTGTVLGDKTATSNSIGNVYKLLKDIHAEEYAELRGINEGVASLHDSMTSVVTRLFQANAEGIVAPAGILQPDRKLGLGSASYKMSASTDLITGMPGVGIVLKLVTDLLQKYDPVQKLLNKIFFGTVKEKVVGGGYAIDPFQIGGQLSASQYNTIERTRKSWISKSVSYREVSSPMNEKVQMAIEDMFNAMGETMLATADALGKSIGMDLSGRVLGYIIPSLRIELYGLSGEEAAKKLNGVMSTIMDDMANVVFGDIVGQYQQLGEGMLETAIRIVSEIAVVTDALKVSGLKLKPENIIEFSDAIVQAVGGLNEFKKAWQTFFDAFYSDAEKQAKLKEQLFGREVTTTRTDPKRIAQDLFGAKTGGPASITEYFDGQLTDLFKLKAPKLTSAQKKAGLSVYDVFPDFDPYKTIKTLAASREGYRQVLESININTVAGQKQYATLIKLAGAADQYYDGLEAQQAKVDDLQNARRDLELQLMEATGHSAEALAERRKKELDAMDESLRPLQEQIYLAQDNLILQQEAQKIAQQQRGLDIQYMQATGNAAGALAAKREDELAAMDESLRPLQLSIYAAEDLLAAQQKAAELAKQQRSLDIELMTAQGNAAGALAAKRADELAAMDESLRATQQAIYDAQDSAAAAADLAEALKKEKEATEQMAAAAQSAAETLRSVSEILAVSGFKLGSNANVLADSLANAAGGLSALQTQFDAYFNGFYTESQRQIINANKLQTALIGLFDQSTIDRMAKSRDAYRQVLEALDLNNSADQQRYLLLLKLAGAANDYYSAIEANAQAIADANQANADAMAQYQKDLEQYNAEIAQQAADAAEQAAEAVAEAITKALQTVADNAQQILNDAISALDKSVQTERDAITAKYNADLEQATTAVDNLTESVNNLKALSASLKSYMDRLATQNPSLLTRAQAQQQIATALQNAKNGKGLPLADDLNNSLSVLAQPSENLFGNFVDYQRDFLKTSISINDLLTVTDAQTSKQVSALDIAQTQLELLKTNYDKEMTRLDDIVKRGDDIVKGTDRTTSAVISVEQALANLTKAVAANNAAQAALEANKAANAAKQTTTTQTPPVAPTAPVLTPVPASIVPSSGFGTANTNNYTGTNVSGAVAAIPMTVADVYRQVLGREAEPEGYTYWSNQLSSGAVTAENLAKTVATAAAAMTASDIASYEGVVPQDELMKSVINAKAWLSAHSYAKGGDHEGGWAMVGERGPELVNLPPSRVFSNSDSKQLLSYDELLAELKQLREEIKAGHIAIASNTKDTRKVLEKWDYDGTPAVRT